MTLMLPQPLRESRDTVTLRRADWESLLERLDDAEDAAAVAERRAREAAIGRDVVRRDYLTGDELRRLLDWESPLKLWREKRGLSQRALAQAAGVSASYLAEIETGRKPGSVEAVANLARALDLPMERLVSGNRPQMALEQLKALLASRISEAAAVAEAKQIIRGLKARGIASSDLSELKGRLRTLATDYGNAGMVDEARIVTTIVDACSF